MDKATMLALMVTAKKGDPGDWESVLTVYADRLERIAPKLTEAELYSMLAVGAAIYQHWCQHTDSERETAEALLRLTGDRPLE
ncbi:hypothetical protein [Achromobacter piechaudii]|uniref:Uncharacterized protein n=1 Tax=Achromobacter piechaudii ATCC 43553 TaxID=742159 RepID=D4XAQ8_9BURK|nr:hypothetical protein [Achromobacter piechaudii]EFF76070.1 hypothetical protein HMPREF0004_2555 [Achromobacter piechaudii ATCC 43553]